MEYSNADGPFRYPGGKRERSPRPRFTAGHQFAILTRGGAPARRAGRELMATLALMLSLFLTFAPATSGAGAAPPPALLVVVLPGDGPRASGTLPAGLTLSTLRRRLPDLDLSQGVSEAGAAPRVPWERALDALALLLPRLAEGTIELRDNRFVARGLLREGFTSAATRSALRLALGPDWQAQLELTEAPPPAHLEILWREGETVLRGLLPGGVEPTLALDLLARGDAKLDASGLTGGGLGDPAPWERALRALARVLTVCREARVRLASGTVDLRATLGPGQRPEAVRTWLEQALGPDWALRLAAEPTAPRVGDVREDLATGRRERWTGETWQAVETTPAP